LRSQARVQPSQLTSLAYNILFVVAELEEANFAFLILKVSDLALLIHAKFTNNNITVMHLN